MGKQLRAVILICFLGIAGCSSDAKELNPDPETKEILSNKQVDIDSPEEILFQSAKSSFQNQLYSVAKDQFTALMNNFPTGAYVEYAELKLADCSFLVRDFDVSAPLYEEYAKSHPGTLSAAYSLLMAARSYHLSSKGVGHDAHALERAREVYGRLLEQYPDSIYAKQAAAYQRTAIDDLTENERTVAEFYRKQGQEAAYNARMKIIAEKWQPLAKSSQEKFNVEEPAVEQDSEVDEEEIEEVEEVADVEAEVEAFEEDGVEGEEIETPQGIEISSNQVTRSVPPAAVPGVITITEVECTDNEIRLHLDQPWSNEDFLLKVTSLQPKNGVVSMALPLTKAQEHTYDCFDTEDLYVSQRGGIATVSDKPLFVRTVSEPPMLILESKSSE